MGSNKYYDCANKILELIGGNENVASVAHCATRLRLVVKDESLIKKEEIENLELVKGAFMNGGQFQVIIGQGIVNKVYAEFSKIAGIKEMSTAEVKAEGAKKLNPFQRICKLLSDIFVPIIPAIVAAGLLMGLLGLAGKFGLEQYSNTWWWMMLDWFSSAAFIFLPVLVAISAAKVFGVNPYLAATVGGIMIHPALQNAWTQGEGFSTVSVLGIIDMPLLGYQGTVLPILIVIFVMAYIEKGIRKVVPEILDILLTPLLTVLITGFLALAVIGPAANFIGGGISTFLTFAIDKLGIFAGLLFGGAYSSIVITGIHHSFHAVELSVLAETGVNTLLPIWSMANVAQGGACFAAFLMTKNKKMKAVALPSAISTLFGITEAAIFGVNLRYKTPFIGAAIGGAVAGAYVVLMKVGMTAVGVTGIPGMAITASGSTLHYIIGLVIALVVAFVSTMIMGIKEEV